MTWTTEAALAALAANGHEKGGAMPTNEEQYEAMVARGHGYLPAVIRTEGKLWMSRGTGCVIDSKAVVSACLLAGQLEAMYSKAHGKHLHAWVAQTGCDPSRLFEFYLAAFPLASPPEPSAAEELLKEARYVIDRLCRDEASSAQEGWQWIAEYDKHAATAGGR